MSMMRASVVGAELTESEATLRVALAAGGLVLLGVLVLMLTIWWWRGTKPESPALGPLEVMSDRKWTMAAEGERRRLVEQQRPAGAPPAFVTPEPVDLSALARVPPTSFDDLRDPIVVSSAGSPDAGPDAGLDPGPVPEPDEGHATAMANGVHQSIDDVVTPDPPLTNVNGESDESVESVESVESDERVASDERDDSAGVDATTAMARDHSSSLDSMTSIAETIDESADESIEESVDETVAMPLPDPSLAPNTRA